jgi:hypothetical protein
MAQEGGLSTAEAGDQRRKRAGAWCGLAERSGVHVNTIKAFESEKSNPMPTAPSRGPVQFVRTRSVHHCEFAVSATSGPG